MTLCASCASLDIDAILLSKPKTYRGRRILKLGFDGNRQRNLPCFFCRLLDAAQWGRKVFTPEPRRPTKMLSHRNHQFSTLLLPMIRFYRCSFCFHDLFASIRHLPDSAQILSIEIASHSSKITHFNPVKLLYCRLLTRCFRIFYTSFDRLRSSNCGGWINVAIQLAVLNFCTIFSFDRVPWLGLLSFWKMHDQLCNRRHSWISST